MDIKISIIKFELIGGKKSAKAFSFRLNPKKFAQYKTEATVKKKIEEHIVKNRMFKSEELKDLKYDMKNFLEAWKKEVATAKTELLKSLDASPNQPESRITPERIERLGANEIFVFGSNGAGRHNGGAARVAAEQFGAIMGQGHGIQGKSYAINSMSGIPEMKQDIDTFCAFAQAHPEKHFLVTPIGCGIAGYTPNEVAPLFADCKELKNISLPYSFWKVIGGPSTMQNYDLNRFLEAQERDYPIALREIQEGRKVSHWIWYIFPQKKGLGRSYNSQFYGLDGIDEARAYLAHPILVERLRTICRALLTHAGKRDIEQIMGSHIDVIKLQSSMNLFNKVSPNDVFKDVLDAFY